MFLGYSNNMCYNESKNERQRPRNLHSCVFFSLLGWKKWGVVQQVLHPFCDRNWRFTVPESGLEKHPKWWFGKVTPALKMAIFGIYSFNFWEVLRGFPPSFSFQKKGLPRNQKPEIHHFSDQTWVIQRVPIYISFFFIMTNHRYLILHS